jgi:hypothetical protein
MVHAAHTGHTDLTELNKGNSPNMRLHILDHFPVERLLNDLAIATSGWDWSQGAYGHSLSLPAREQIHPAERDHANNIPYADVLDRCPFFREIFDSFECEKASFRLLRRPPLSSYAWHTDQDKGPEVVRFQIPIITNDQSTIVITDYRQYDEFRFTDQRMSEEEAFEQYPAFKQADQGHFEEHVLEAGRLYYFNTSRFHNLFNRGTTERITLAMDFVVNDWLRRRYPAIEEECAASGV